MTKTQIKSMLDELGFNVNTLIDMKDVASIYLTSDNMLYPDEASRLYFRMDGDINLLEVYKGKEVGEEFVPDSKYPNTFYTFDIISGLYKVSPLHKKSIYKYGMAV